MDNDIGDGRATTRGCRHVRDSSMVRSLIFSSMMMTTTILMRRSIGCRVLVTINHQQAGKPSGSINILFGVSIFECFNTRKSLNGPTVCPFQPLLQDKITVQSERCPLPEAISPEIVVSIGLCYLSGGKCLDLKNVYTKVLDIRKFIYKTASIQSTQ